MDKSKKYFTLLLFLLVFSGFLAVQISGNLLSQGSNSFVNSNEENIKIYDELFKSESFHDLDGNKIFLGNHTDKIVVINFWASWCNNCIEEIPSIVKGQEKFKNKLFVLSVNVDEKDQMVKVNEIIKKEKINYPVVLDYEHHISKLFKITGLPTSIVYKHGTLFDIYNGPIDLMSMEFENLLSGLND